MTLFWQRWLTLWCLGIGLFGLVLYGAGFAPTTGPAALTFLNFQNPLPAEPDRFLRFAISLMGAVTAGWAITLYCALRAAWALEGPQSAMVWRGLLAGIAAWYVIDSGASIDLGFALNALSNTLFVLAFLVPVIATRAWSSVDRVNHK